MLNLTLNDVVHIGTSAYDSGRGFTNFISDRENSHLECLQLRAILEGAGYVVIAIEDFTWTDGKIATMFVTNLPYDLYSNIMSKHAGSIIIHQLAQLEKRYA